MNAVTRPAVRWLGGKWKLSPWIIANMPPHDCYVEPYGGGGSVLLRKSRVKDEVYSDLDSEIVNLFRVYRDRGDELKEKLYLTPFSREEFILSYEATDCDLEQARRTVVRAFMGFGTNSHAIGTGFRASSRKSGTGPSREWMNYPDAMQATIDRLRGVVIENRDACEVMQAQDTASTLHYVDPPYVHDTRGGRAKYRYEMNDRDHRALAGYLKTVKGMVLLSGYRSELYDELYSDWYVVERCAHADGARDRVEVLWMNYEPVQADMFGGAG